MLDIKIRKMIVRSLIIILSATIVGIIYNFITPAGIPLINNYSLVEINKEIVKIPLFLPRDKEQHNNLEIHPPEEIRLKAVHANFYHGEAVFIDARTNEKYKEGHIPGAISVPVNEVKPENINLENLGLQQKIIVYCDDPGCSLSMELATILEHKGFLNVYFFSGGWKAWKQADYQISKSK
ncbi:MAG: rhodanese-like domain-containing protein [Candidatus Marinimicrobia bacterium]|nr:rhodanese-like domain-containing protein [Candidatus Neomarinimicrobiota bacterium]